jgi:hypothetical protein
MRPRCCDRARELAPDAVGPARPAANWPVRPARAQTVDYGVASPSGTLPPASRPPSAWAPRIQHLCANKNGAVVPSTFPAYDLPLWTSSRPARTGAPPRLESSVVALGTLLLSLQNPWQIDTACRAGALVDEDVCHRVPVIRHQIACKRVEGHEVTIARKRRVAGFPPPMCRRWIPRRAPFCWSAGRAQRCPAARSYEL